MFPHEVSPLVYQGPRIYSNSLYWLIYGGYKLLICPLALTVCDSVCYLYLVIIYWRPGRPLLPLLLHSFLALRNNTQKPREPLALQIHWGSSSDSLSRSRRAKGFHVDVLTFVVFLAGIPHGKSLGSREGKHKRILVR